MDDLYIEGYIIGFMSIVIENYVNNVTSFSDEAVDEVLVERYVAEERIFGGIDEKTKRMMIDEYTEILELKKAGKTEDAEKAIDTFFDKHNTELCSTILYKEAEKLAKVSNRERTKLHEIVSEMEYYDELTRDLTDANTSGQEILLIVSHKFPSEINKELFSDETEKRIELAKELKRNAIKLDSRKAKEKLAKAILRENGEDKFFSYKKFIMQVNSEGKINSYCIQNVNTKRAWYILEDSSTGESIRYPDVDDCNRIVSW